MNPIKYILMMVAYLWLRFDPILYITFRKDWTPRYEFLSTIFGEEAAEKFLNHRINLVKARNKILPPIILLTDVDKKITEFLKIKLGGKLNKNKRLVIIEQLIYWATDPEINRFNIDSYKSRSAIVDGLLNPIFQNSITSEINCILDGLKKIVFSRVTYLGSKGEPSPVVHNVILSGAARILTSHFNELVRLRDEKLDKMIKVKLIKEIQKSKSETGSLAFSAEPKINEDFQNKYPLPNYQAKLLWKIFTHYQFSAWPESREKAAKLIDNFQKQLGFSPEELFASHPN